MLQAIGRALHEIDSLPATPRPVPGTDLQLCAGRPGSASARYLGAPEFAASHARHRGALRGTQPNENRLSGFPIAPALLHSRGILTQKADTLLDSYVRSSGVTPVNSMPPFLQSVMVINRLLYSLDLTKRVYLEGAGFAQLLSDFLPLAVIVLVTLSGTAWLFRRRLT